ncbi:O-methyltransferase [Microvirga sp. CF3016]|uniref:O-methyltransferase n=1 Tax=Microvirga sp. CF3016 TaxID=3110181 RepID=UPI002E7A6F09|nr:class I SAM-dependent methyltransferase [Microvirga sp. CF3016]MEE1612153.1 class I SAM-dependent methyltransferase [Microvirga sp. CF3016]
MLKEAVKTVLPTSVTNQYFELRGKIRLQKIPVRAFDTRNLRRFSSVDISHGFSDPEIAKAWEDDHQAISQLYRAGELTMGVNPGDRRAIYSLVMSLRPQNVLEIGTYIGTSAIYMAAALQRLHGNRRLTTVDIFDVNHPKQGAWKDVGLSTPPAECAKALGLSEHVQFHVGASQDFMRETDERYDLIFLDGDHDAWAIYEELSLALPLLQKDGIILLHDFYPGGKPIRSDGYAIGGPFRAVERAQREDPAIQVLPLGTLPWQTQPGSNTTTLALVLKTG